MDLTARIRDELLAKHSEANDIPHEPGQVVREGPIGGFTAHLARQLRDIHDQQHQGEA